MMGSIIIVKVDCLEHRLVELVEIRDRPVLQVFVLYSPIYSFTIGILPGVFAHTRCDLILGQLTSVIPVNVLSSSIRVMN